MWYNVYLPTLDFYMKALDKNRHGVFKIRFTWIVDNYNWVWWVLFALHSKAFITKYQVSGILTTEIYFLQFMGQKDCVKIAAIGISPKASFSSFIPPCFK